MTFPIPPSLHYFLFLSAMPVTMTIVDIRLQVSGMLVHWPLSVHAACLSPSVPSLHMKPDSHVKIEMFVGNIPFCSIIAFEIAYAG